MPTPKTLKKRKIPYNPYIIPGICEAFQIITNTVHQQYGVSLACIFSPSRKRVYVVPRMLCMRLLFMQASMTKSDIGRAFGNRDHSTVIHAIQTIEDLMDTDRIFRKEVQDLDVKVSGLIKAITQPLAAIDGA